MPNVYIQKTNCLYINLGMSIHEAMVYIDSWFLGAIGTTLDMIRMRYE